MFVLYLVLLLKILVCIFIYAVLYSKATYAKKTDIIELYQCIECDADFI